MVYFTIKQAAEAVHVSTHVVREWLRNGLPSVRPGRVVLIEPDALVAYVRTLPQPVAASSDGRRERAERGTKAARGSMISALDNAPQYAWSCAELVKAGGAPVRAGRRAWDALVREGILVPSGIRGRYVDSGKGKAS